MDRRQFGKLALTGAAGAMTGGLIRPIPAHAGLNPYSADESTLRFINYRIAIGPMQWLKSTTPGALGERRLLYYAVAGALQQLRAIGFDQTLEDIVSESDTSIPYGDANVPYRGMTRDYYPDTTIRTFIRQRMNEAAYPGRASDAYTFYRDATGDLGSDHLWAAITGSVLAYWQEEAGPLSPDDVGCDLVLPGFISPFFPEPKPPYFGMNKEAVCFWASRIVTLVGIALSRLTTAGGVLYGVTFGPGISVASAIAIVVIAAWILNQAYCT